MGKVPRGLPKSYIKKWGISKLAWRKFRAGALTKGIRTRTKAIKRRIRRSRRTRRKNPGRKRVVRRMARRKRRRGGKSMTRTAFKLVRLAALGAPALAHATSSASTDDKIKHIIMDYTGYNLYSYKWQPEKLLRGWGAYLGACLATYGIPKMVSIIRRL